MSHAFVNAVAVFQGRQWRPWILFFLALFSAVPAFARGEYEQPDVFVRNAFNGKPPAAKMLWLDAAMQKRAAEILGHPYSALRVRYWGVPGRTAWVLDEIGKDEPITVGIIVNRGKLELVKVLIFRESRGDEVRHPFFTDQFTGARLSDGHVLDKPIDGISGATLSVRALNKLARLALYFHSQSEFAQSQSELAQ